MWVPGAVHTSSYFYKNRNTFCNETGAACRSPPHEAYSRLLCSEFHARMKRVNSKCSNVQLRANSPIYSRLVWTHLHTHTHTDRYTQTDTHRQTDRHTCRQTDTHTRTHHTHAHTHRQTQTHTHTHTRTHVQTDRHTHTHAHTDRHTHTHTHTHTDRQTQTHTHTRADTDTHTRRQTHTHTHTHVQTDRQTHTHTDTHTHAWDSHLQRHRWCPRHAARPSVLQTHRGTADLDNRSCRTKRPDRETVALQSRFHAVRRSCVRYAPSSCLWSGSEWVCLPWCPRSSRACLLKTWPDSRGSDCSDPSLRKHHDGIIIRDSVTDTPLHFLLLQNNSCCFHFNFIHSVLVILVHQLKSNDNLKWNKLKYLFFFKKVVCYFTIRYMIMYFFQRTVFTFPGSSAAEVVTVRLTWRAVNGSVPQTYFL